jgi:hypothetical protein
MMIDIMAGISSATALARAAIDYLEGNQDAQKKIIDLNMQLMDVHQKAMQLLQENSELQTRLREIEEQQRLDDAVYFQNEACWRNDKEGQEKGPFCHVCWAKETRLINLEYRPRDVEKRPDFDPHQELDQGRQLRGRWYCPICKMIFMRGSDKEKPDSTEAVDSWISSRD